MEIVAGQATCGARPGIGAAERVGQPETVDHRRQPRRRHAGPRSDQGTEIVAEMDGVVIMVRRVQRVQVGDGLVQVTNSLDDFLSQRP